MAELKVYTIAISSSVWNEEGYNRLDETAVNLKIFATSPKEARRKLELVLEQLINSKTLREE